MEKRALSRVGRVHDCGVRERHRARGSDPAVLAEYSTLGMSRREPIRSDSLPMGNSGKPAFAGASMRLLPGNSRSAPAPTFVKSAQSILSLDILDLYEQLDQPLLVYVNVGEQRMSTTLSTEEQRDMATYAAYRQRLRDELVELASRQPNMRVQATTEGHDFFWRDPAGPEIRFSSFCRHWADEKPGCRRRRLFSDH